MVVLAAMLALAMGAATMAADSKRRDLETQPGQVNIQPRPCTEEPDAEDRGMGRLTTKIVVSKDGKTRTLTQTGKNANGQDVKNLAVYDKQ
jgi:hypothetical protein